MTTNGLVGLTIALFGGVTAMALIEQTALYPPPKRGLQAVLAIAMGVVVLRYVGIM